MTPPPITTSRAGTRSMSIAPVLVTTPGRSRPGIGGSAGIDPGARMTWWAVISPGRPRRGPTSSNPAEHARPRREPAHPPGLEQLLDSADELVHDRLLVGHQPRQIDRGLRDRKAELAALLARVSNSAVVARALVGMQPTLRHVPPTSLSRPGPRAPRAGPPRAQRRTRPALRRGWRRQTVRARMTSTFVAPVWRPVTPTHRGPVAPSFDGEHPHARGELVHVVPPQQVGHPLEQLGRVRRGRRPQHGRSASRPGPQQDAWFSTLV